MKKIILAIVLLSLACSCIEDSRNNNMVDDSLSIVFTEQVVPVSVYAGSHKVTVLKAGKGTLAAKVNVDNSIIPLDLYNADEEHDVKYQAVTSPYTLSANTLSFEAQEVTKSITVDWNPDAVYPELVADNFVIPVRISEGSIGVNEKRSFVLLNLLNSSVRLASSGSTVLAKETPSEDGEVSLKISIDNVLPKDLTVNLAVDNSLVDQYNEQKGTAYTAAPEGYVLVPEAGTAIEAGSSDVFATVKLKTSVLYDAAGEIMNFKTFVVPMKISGTSEKGIVVSDSVYYLLVVNPFAGATFSRVWGKYSIEAPWTEGYGLPFGTDRTLTMDKDWVYLPYAVGGKVAKITAISVNDPDNITEVNCTGFVTNVITTACVRVIDRGNGTTMLTASGANADTFAFYAWENGISAPPTVYSLECTWRRSGDRYEFHGSWADGVLWVHSYQGTFATRYIVKDGAFVSTSRTLIEMPYTGFGGLFAYPGQDQMVFASSDDAAFVSLTGTTRPAGDGQYIHETSREAFAGASMSYGYRPFSFKADSFIAYTTFDKNDDTKEDGTSTYTTLQRARLVVVKDKGGFKASLDGDNKDIIFEAPLQGEDFKNMSVVAPQSLQGDCAVVVLSDKVLIAAGAQGLGVSVFKLE